MNASSSYWSFFAEHRAEILGATADHLTLVVLAMLIAMAIALPVGMLIVERPALRALSMGIANVFQTIPSLALFGLLIPIPFIGGIGRRTAIVALVLYALLPILRNTYVGLSGIDPAVLEAAEAMGMTSVQILFRVRVPLALSVILAGIRTATVITIGVATIAAEIGAGGLGTFIFRGVALVSDALILAGAMPAALLALLADFLLGLLERRLKVACRCADITRGLGPLAAAACAGSFGMTSSSSGAGSYEFPWFAACAWLTWRGCCPAARRRNQKSLSAQNSSPSKWCSRSFWRSISKRGQASR